MQVPDNAPDNTGLACSGVLPRFSQLLDRKLSVIVEDSKILSAEQKSRSVFRKLRPVRLDPTSFPGCQDPRAVTLRYGTGGVGTARLLTQSIFICTHSCSTKKILNVNI